MGKTSFFRKYFQPRGYQHVNQDTLKTRSKCFEAAQEALRERLPIVVDNTSPAAETRQDWIHLSKEFSVPIRCFHFTGSEQLAWHNNLFRALVPRPDGAAFDRTLLPAVAYTSFSSRFEMPKLIEGFNEVCIVYCAGDLIIKKYTAKQQIKSINFIFQGTIEERRLYSLWLELGAKYKSLEQPERVFRKR